MRASTTIRCVSNVRRRRVPKSLNVHPAFSSVSALRYAASALISESAERSQLADLTVLPVVTPVGVDGPEIQLAQAGHERDLP